MTVVTAALNNSSRPAEGFHHPDANHAVVTDGHLILYTHNGGNQVALYPPKTWMQVYDGEKVQHIDNWKKFLKEGDA